MFGPDDAFLTTLVRLVRMLPVCPLFGNGRTKLQPAYVEDIGEAISRLLAEPSSASAIYELGGPRAYTYRALLEEIAARLRLRRRFLPVPFAAWRLLATMAERLPAAGLTRNQVELMERNNVPSGALPGLQDLHIDPTPIEKVLAEILPSIRSERGP
jgi:NADH dehydrogenase